MSENDKLGAAIKELNTYKQMRGPKPAPGVQDDVDDLIAGAQQRQTELAQSKAAAAQASQGVPSAKATASAAPSAKPSAAPSGSINRTAPF
jgi:hypothetical protein